MFSPAIFGAQARNGDVRWAARHGLTLVPERRQLYPDLTTADNILLGCPCLCGHLVENGKDVGGQLLDAVKLFCT